METVVRHLCIFRCQGRSRTNYPVALDDAFVREDTGYFPVPDDDFLRLAPGGNAAPFFYDFRRQRFDQVFKAP